MATVRAEGELIMELETQAQEQEVKSYSQEEVDKMLQSETDKRITSALATAKGKWEEEYSKKLEVEKSEAEKLATMSEGERLQAEFAKEKELFLQQKAEFDKAQIEMVALKELTAKQMPASFLQFVVDESAEKVSERINTLQTEWQEALNSAVENKMAGRTPQVASVAGTKVLTRKEFGSLPTAERMALLESDPDLISKLQ